VEYPSGPLLEYNPAKVTNPPTNTDELLAWAKAHPGRFQYAVPKNSGPGRTFLMGLPYILGDSDPKNPTTGWDKTWAYLKDLGQYTAPYESGTGNTMTNLGKGTVDMIASTTGWDINPRVLGTVPDTVKITTLKGFHWVNDAQYAVVPKGVGSDKLSAIINLLQYMLTPAQQAIAFDKGLLLPRPGHQGRDPGDGTTGQPGRDQQARPGGVRRPHRQQPAGAVPAGRPAGRGVCQVGHRDRRGQEMSDRRFDHLRLEKVTRRFGDKVVLDALDLHIAGGEFVALLGPSGCGKSTALNCLAGLLPLSGGSIWLDNKRVDTLPPERRGFGMVFQNYALFPHMSVRRNIGFGLRMRGAGRSETRRRVDEALRLVQLPQYASRLPGQLSGGQQQRVAIARAVVIEPPLVLMDEPLSNLDAALRLDMRTEIRRLHQSLGLTTVYVTHDQEEALSLADRLVVLREGVVQQVGTPRRSSTARRPTPMWPGSWGTATCFR